MLEELKLREAVYWALGRISARPDVAARAATALDRCIGSLEATAWPGAVAFFSGLNGDGFPIEFAFSSNDELVRFTAEAAPPEVKTEARLSRAVALLNLLGGFEVPITIHEDIARMQAGRQLIWGAAVGGRHGPSGDSFKLYAEVPTQQPDILNAELRAARLQRMPRLVMVGWEPASNRLERYFRCEGLAPGELFRILDVSGLAVRAREIERALEAAWQGTMDEALLTEWGLSLAGPCYGPCEALSLFKEANRVFGGDAKTRAGLLSLVKQLGYGTLAAYSRVSAPLQSFPGAGAHGMLALSVASGRSLELRVGLSPAASFRAAREISLEKEACP